MGTTLTIAALGILVLVIGSVSRWVRKEKPEGAWGRLLSALVVLFLCIFALVSLSAASQLAENSSGVAQLALFLFVVLGALLVRVAWSSAKAY